jgi:hypothetical protein
VTSDRQLSADLFEPLIGQPFVVRLKDGSVTLTLRKVTRLPPPRRDDSAGGAVPITGGARRDPFTLLFGGASHLLPQRIYALTSGTLGDSVDIFIVPVGQDHDGFIYEAVFG